MQVLRKPKRDKVLLPPYNPLPIEVHRRRRRRALSVVFALIVVSTLIGVGLAVK